ncbi:MAG TPA: hypothetical protein VMG81_07785 [Thermoplasmata archaeon]|nr:hypothetical protein [Thermoplasmata archaeon]
MNRTIVGMGLVILLFSFMLLAFPIVVTGAETFDFEQEAGIFVLPVGLLIILFGAMGHNPEATTVGGAFGNLDDAPRRPGGSGRAPPARAPLGYNPKEPVACRYCRTIIPYDIAICPRCARPRACRTCGRPLGLVLDRPTCPTCARAEVFCACPALPRPNRGPPVGRRVPRV